MQVNQSALLTMQISVILFRARLHSHLPLYFTYLLKTLQELFPVRTTCGQLSTHHKHVMHSPLAPHWTSTSVSSRGRCEVCNNKRWSSQERRCLMTHNFRCTLNWCQSCNQAASVDKFHLNFNEPYIYFLFPYLFIITGLLTQKNISKTQYLNKCLLCCLNKTKLATI